MYSGDETSVPGDLDCFFSVVDCEYCTIFAAKYRIHGREEIPEKKVDTETPQ